MGKDKSVIMMLMVMLAIALIPPVIAGEISNVLKPQQNIGTIMGGTAVQLSFGASFQDSTQSLAIILLNYTVGAWEYKGFEAYMDGTNVTSKFTETHDPTTGRIMINCSSVSPANGNLIVNLKFRAGNVEGNYTFTWRYVYIAFQPPPAMPTKIDETGKTYAYVVSGFTVSVSPSSGTVAQGGSTSASVTVASIGGYNKIVTLSASGQPTGVSIQFSPGSGSPPFTSNMTVNVGANVQPGTYNITITGTGEDGKVQSTKYTLMVAIPDFDISVSPASGSVFKGKSTTATINVASIMGYNLLVNLSATVAGPTPDKISVSFSPSSGVPSFISTMTVTAASDATPGGYTITIKGTGADGKVHSKVYSLTVKELYIGGLFIEVDKLGLIMPKIGLCLLIMASAIALVLLLRKILR